MTRPTRAEFVRDFENAFQSPGYRALAEFLAAAIYDRPAPARYPGRPTRRALERTIRDLRRQLDGAHDNAKDANRGYELMLRRADRAGEEQRRAERERDLARVGASSVSRELAMARARIAALEADYATVPANVEAAVARAVAEERGACAALADAFHTSSVAGRIRDQILGRARGKVPA